MPDSPLTELGQRLSEAFESINDWAVRYRAWLFAGTTVFLLLLVIWARAGLTLEVGRFFAAEPEGPTCGLSIPEGGAFDWQFVKNENWDIECKEGQSTINFSEDFFVGANVGACHPDGLHLVWRAIYRPVADCSFGSDDLGYELTDGDGIRFELDPTISQMDWDDGQAGKALMYYDPAEANCGSIHMYGGFWAEGLQGVYRHNNAGNQGWHLVLNYGRDCTGAPGERLPGSGGGGGGGTGGGGGSCPAHPGNARPANLGAACSGGAVRLSWENPLDLDAEVNSVIRNINGGDGEFIFSEGGCWNTFGIGTFMDSDIAPGNTYSYRVKTDSNVVSNTVSLRVNSDGTCEPVTTSIPSPPPNPTPLSTPTPLPTPTSTVTTSPSSSPTPTFTSLPTPTATQISQPTVSPTPATQALGLQSFVRNLSTGGEYGADASGKPGQRFQVRLDMVTSAAVSNVSVRSALPNTLIYVPGTTTINGAPTSVNTVTLDGLSLGTVSGAVAVAFTVEAVDASAFISTTTEVAILSSAAGDGVSPVGADSSIFINASGVAPGAGQVQTGPQDAAIFALVAAALCTLLYVSYTRSDRYRSREANTLGAKRDPMDFKS